jgi:hypothetical protein
MRLAPLAVAITVVGSLVAARPDPGIAANRLIPFAVNVDLAPAATYTVASFIDTSACERFVVLLAGSGATGHVRLQLRYGLPTTEGTVAAGGFGPVQPHRADETGSMWIWSNFLETIAPRMQPVLSNSHPTDSLHITQASIYCQVEPRRP